MLDDDEIRFKDLFAQLRRGEDNFDPQSTASLIIRMLNQTGLTINSLYELAEEQHFINCLCWECVKRKLNEAKVSSENFSV